MGKKAIIIGSGFSGMSSASFMAKAGYDVTVIEKHSMPGGRARRLSKSGFHFDMGPSWYWMPDVFERYFAAFGKNVCDYYSLSLLDPSYRVFWNDHYDDIPHGVENLKRLFEQWEPGAAKNLEKFLDEASFKYRMGMQKMVYKPGLRLTEFADREVMKGMMQLDMFTSVRTHISKFFKHPAIRQLLEFPILFLGAHPENTPALYTLMNHADINGGTWYPQGGMYSVVDGMHKLAKELGVRFFFNEHVTGFEISNSRINSVLTDLNDYHADVVIGSADYHFIEQKLLPARYRSYSSAWWQRRKLAPSCLIYYVGLDKKLNNIRHHNLFFDAPFETHSTEIYKTRSWPTDPLFYVCASSVTDASVAPPGCENLFFLVPISAGLFDDDEWLREHYFDMIVKRLEKHTGEKISGNIIYKESFATSDFVNEYHSFNGNAYGLANTLNQTAFLKPKCKSSKISNLYYTGQLTVPGPGVPPSLISGEVVAGVAHRYQNEQS
ncbi:MAG: phytoene desaturase [Chitinophagaceae bacterium]|nr:phytoene desaturase [Chitinophagaceae bacterium]